MKNTAIGMKEMSYDIPFCINKLSSILKSESDSLSESQRTVNWYWFKVIAKLVVTSQYITHLYIRIPTVSE